jgi:flagellar hook-associated protein 3 FlgL
MRVTDRMVMDRVVQNLSKNFEKYLQLQTQISSGKRINKPSDDSVGTTKDLGYRSKLAEFDQFFKNITAGKAWLGTTDSTLGEMSDLITSAKELAVQFNNATYDETARRGGAEEVKDIFDKILQLGNSQFGSRYIFSGFATLTPAFRTVGEGVVYQGDEGEFKIEFDSKAQMMINLVGSNLLTKPFCILGKDADLNPGIDNNTLLSELHQGQGVNLSSPSLTITDNNTGVPTIVTISDINSDGRLTIADAIECLNSAGISNFSAKISPIGNTLRIEVTSSGTTTANFTISENGGTIAEDLGILGNVKGIEGNTTNPGIMDGKDLDPQLTLTTSLSLLNNGLGFDLSAFKIVNGEYSASINLTSTTTVGELIDSINSQGIYVLADINASGKGISVESTITGRSLVISDLDGGKTAQNLGIAGSPDIFGNLLVLKQAILDDNNNMISSALGRIDLGLNEILSARASVGAKVNRLETTETRLNQHSLTTTKLLSEVEDADLFKVTTDLASQQLIYQAALQAAAKLLGPSLLDFMK